MQLGHAVAHLEWVRPPGYEQALRIHADRLLCQQQHLSFLRAKPWPHRLIYPAASSTRVPEAAASASSEQSAPPRGLGMAYLTPTCGATCSMCGRRACQVTTPHEDHVCFACEQQALRQQQRLVESESESCS